MFHRIFSIFSHKKPTPAKKQPTKKTRNGFVYFIIESPFQDRAKIGRAKNPQQRLAQLQTGNPLPLKVHQTIETSDAPKLEADIHRHLKARNIKNEWYAISLHEINIVHKKFTPKPARQAWSLFSPSTWSFPALW